MLTCLFFSYIIQKDRFQAHPEKIRAVEDWPIPKTRKELQQFLGFANFHTEADFTIRQTRPLPRDPNGLGAQ